MRYRGEVLEATGKTSISLTNESHDFYTEYVPNKDVLKWEKKFAAIVKILKKELPGGTWAWETKE